MIKTLNIKVKPNQKETKLLSEKEGGITVAIACPPEKGRANKELLKFLKKHFNAERVEIIAGATSRRKVVKIWKKE